MKKIAAFVKKSHRKSYLSCFVIALLLIVLALVGNLRRSTYYTLEQMAIAVLLAVSLSFVVGFLGELSLGHAGFMCIGAYLGGKTAALLSAGLGNSLPTLLLSVLVGGVAAALAGAVIGLPALRLKGDYLAIVTLAFGEIVRTLFCNSGEATFGGAFGLESPRYDYHHLYRIAFVFVILAVIVFQNVIRSKHGRAVTAIRDNEIAARATGIDVTKYKLLAFTLSAFFAGVAGVLYSYTQSRVQSATFDYNYSIEILVTVVLGGIGSMNGSIVAAALITFLNNKLATVLTGNLAVLQNMVYALFLIFIVIFGNAPALASFRERYSPRALMKKLFPKKRDPAEITPDEGAWDRIPTKIAMDEVLSTDLTPDPAEKNSPDKEKTR